VGTENAADPQIPGTIRVWSGTAAVNRSIGTRYILPNTALGNTSETAPAQQVKGRCRFQLRDKQAAPGRGIYSRRKDFDQSFRYFRVISICEINISDYRKYAFLLYAKDMVRFGCHNLFKLMRAVILMNGDLAVILFVSLLSGIIYAPALLTPKNKPSKTNVVCFIEHKTKRHKDRCS
jgi:hypothetical protein